MWQANVEARHVPPPHIPGRPGAPVPEGEDVINLHRWVLAGSIALLWAMTLPDEPSASESALMWISIAGMIVWAATYEDKP